MRMGGRSVACWGIKGALTSREGPQEGAAVCKGRMEVVHRAALLDTSPLWQGSSHRQEVL